MLHSQVFQFYKDHFPNRGEYPLKAVNWFFNGVFQKRIYETDPVDPSAGFFRPWLGTNSLGKEYLNYELTRDGFNRIVKHALSSGQGMMFVINLGKTGQRMPLPYGAFHSTNRGWQIPYIWWTTTTDAMMHAARSVP